MRFLIALALALQCANGSLISGESENGANPIRRVVTMLQAMVKKVTAEGEKEEELYKKFQCYCKTGGSDLSASIADNDAKAPELESSIAEGESKHAQLAEDLKSHQSDRSAAKSAMKEATAIREKAAAAFAAVKSEADTNIAALGGAIKALESGMAGFIQTRQAVMLKKLILTKQDMPDVDRQDVLSFLSGGDNGGYAPASGQIVGILKQLKKEMETTLKEETDEEKESIASYDGLMAAKTKEKTALTASIEAKTKRRGELAVEIVQLKNSLSDTQAALIEDKKYLADLSKNCDSKAAEWEEIQKTRAEELVALHETIKVLNDDDALDLFKKTLPSPSASFVQMKAASKATRTRALAIVHKLQHNSALAANKPGLDLISLALQGRAVGFEKVIKMVDDMIAMLKTEQTDDDNKKEYCAISLDKAEDKQKSLDRDISGLEASIADADEGIAKATDEIKALTKGIAALDKSVAQATEQRKEEHAEFTELMSSDTTAKELLHFAKNRLNKFYNPKLYKPPAERQLTEEQRITVNMGGSLDPTPAPGGIAGTGIGFMQIRAHVQTKRDAPGPPPETFDGYNKKGEESTGVIAMIDLLVKDLDKQMTEAETDERNSQMEYEQMMSDSAEKRALDSKALTENENRKATLEGNRETHKEDKASATKELMATQEYISTLHGECDWLVKYFDARKEARAGEIDSLNNAKAVLSGADFEFAQVASLRGSQRRT